MFKGKLVGKAIYFNFIMSFYSRRYTFMLQEDFRPIDVLVTWNCESRADASVSLSVQNKLINEWKE